MTLLDLMVVFGVLFAPLLLIAYVLRLASLPCDCPVCTRGRELAKYFAERNPADRVLPKGGSGTAPPSWEWNRGNYS